MDGGQEISREQKPPPPTCSSATTQDPSLDPCCQNGALTCVAGLQALATHLSKPRGLWSQQTGRHSTPSTSLPPGLAGRSLCLGAAVCTHPPPRLPEVSPGRPAPRPQPLRDSLLEPWAPKSHEDSDRCQEQHRHRCGGDTRLLSFPQNPAGHPQRLVLQRTWDCLQAPRPGTLDSTQPNWTSPVARARSPGGPGELRPRRS